MQRGAPAARFILYLSRETWRGDAGDALAEEVRAARYDGTPITMVHSTPDNEDDGCDFSLFFATVRPCPRTRAIREPSTAHVHAPAPLIADPGGPDPRGTVHGARPRAAPAALPPRLRLPHRARPRRAPPLRERDAERPEREPPLYFGCGTPAAGDDWKASDGKGHACGESNDGACCRAAGRSIFRMSLDVREPVACGRTATTRGSETNVDDKQQGFTSSFYRGLLADHEAFGRRHCEFVGSLR